MTAKRLKRLRAVGGTLLAHAGLQQFGRRYLGGLTDRIVARERELRDQQRSLHARQTSSVTVDEIRGTAAPETNSPVLLLLNDCRDQDNYGAQVLVDGLLQILSQCLPSYGFRAIPSHWVMDTTHGFGAFVNGGANLRQPQAVWPQVADQFEAVADEWLRDRGGAGSHEFLNRMKGADVVVLNGEGSIYRRNDSAIRELFLAWFAKTRLNIPTVFLNGTVHLTKVVPIVPAMVRKTFAVLDAVSVREPCSLRNLREYAPNIEARMVPDSAFWFAKELANHERLLNPLAQRLAGVEYFTFDPGAMPIDHRFGQESALFSLITELKKIVPQPVLVQSAPSDSYIESLAGQTDSIYVRALPDYRALMGLLSDAKFMVTGRYHNPILGALVGCPSITFASSNHKVHGVCEILEGLIGTPYDSTDLRSNIEAITAQATRYVADQSGLRAQLAATAARLGESTLEMGEMVTAALTRSASEIYRR